mgnify:CR=1 FL=1
MYSTNIVNLKMKTTTKYILRIITFVVMFLSYWESLAQNKNVLVLNSYHLGFQSFKNEYNGIISVFEKYSVNSDFEFMDAKRIAFDSLYTNFYKSLKLNHPDINKFDAVLVCHDHALKFVSIYRDSLFKNIPIVFCGINNLSATNVFDDDSLTIGVFENLHVYNNLQKLLTLFPSARKIYVVSDGTLTSNCDEMEFAKEEIRFPKITFEHIRLENLSYSELAEELAVIPKSDIVVVISAAKDRNGINKNLGESVQYVANLTDAPVFNFYDVTIGNGNIGGYLVSHYQQGKIAAEMVANVLKGNNKISDYNFVFDSTSSWVYNYNVMHKFGIKPNKVDKNSFILNYQTFWTTKNIKIIFYTLILILFLIFATILIVRQKRKLKNYTILINNKTNQMLELNKKLTQTIEESEFNNQKFEILSDLMVESFLVGWLPNQKIRYVNRSFIELTGFKADELIGCDIKDILIISQNSGIKSFDDRNLRGKSFSAKLVCNNLKTKTVFVTCGSRKLLDNPNYICFAIADLTEKIEQSKKISDITSKMIEGERKYFIIFDRMYEGVVILDSDFTIVESNRAMCDITKYSKQELCGLNFGTLIQNYLQLEIPKNQFARRCEFSLRQKNGNMILASLVANKITLKQKEYYMCIVNDISEQKKYENDIIEAKNMAEQTNLIINEFISSMAHEVRTPLNGIVGFSGLIDEKLKDNAEIKRYTEIIINCSNQLNKIVGEILEVSRLTSKRVKSKLSDVCANILLMEVYSIFIVNAEVKKLSFRLIKSLSDEKSTFISDGKKIVSILSQLVDNAIKYTVAGFVEIGYRVNNNKISFYVKDSGTGIDEKYKDFIFKKFGQASKKIIENSGLGLGLTIAKETAKIIGGDIYFNSKIAEGSEFILELPFKNTQENNNDDQNYHKIILAEDDEINFLFMENFIKKTNLKIKILEAKNGQEAVDLLAANPDVKLILMDIKMPVMDGITATSIIRKYNKKIKIIAQTAYASSDDYDRFIAAGCNSVITKPIDSDKFLSILKSIC